MHSTIHATAVRLSMAVAAPMAIASMAGLADRGLYRDPAFFVSAWFWNDLVNLFAAALLVAAGRAAGRGSSRAVLALTGLLHFALYDYAFYLFGAALNPIYPAYAAIVVLSALALLATLSGIDAHSLAVRFAWRTPARLIGGYMVAWSAILAAIWIGQWLVFVVTGTVPQVGGSESAFLLVAGLDLTLIVPGVALAGVWIWRRRPWGFILAILLNVSGALYAVVLFAGTLGHAAEGVPDAAMLLPLWGFFAVASALAAAALLRNLMPKGPLDLRVQVRVAATL